MTRSIIEEWGHLVKWPSKHDAHSGLRIADHRTLRPTGRGEYGYNRVQEIESGTGSPHGYFTNARVHLEVQKSPRASKVMGMNPSQYCHCYVAHMRGALGDDMAHQYLTSVRIPSNLNVIAVSKATDGAYEACTAEQIPFK